MLDGLLNLLILWLYEFGDQMGARLHQKDSLRPQKSNRYKIYHSNCTGGKFHAIDLDFGLTFSCAQKNGSEKLH